MSKLAVFTYKGKEYTLRACTSKDRLFHLFTVLKWYTGNLDVPARMRNLQRCIDNQLAICFDRQNFVYGGIYNKSLIGLMYNVSAKRYAYMFGLYLLSLDVTNVYFTPIQTQQFIPLKYMVDLSYNEDGIAKIDIKHKIRTNIRRFRGIRMWVKERSFQIL